MLLVSLNTKYLKLLHRLFGKDYRVHTLFTLYCIVVVLLKIHFVEFYSSDDLKSYFRGLEIHVQNLISLSLLVS